jgi:hypothetical protein
MKNKVDNEGTHWKKLSYKKHTFSYKSLAGTSSKQFPSYPCVTAY